MWPFRKKLMSANTAGSNSFVIPVDYDQPNAIATAIEDGRFDDNFLGIDPSQVRLSGRGKAAHEVFEYCFGKMIYTLDLLAEFRKPDFTLKFADPLTALRYAAKLPDQQRKHTLAILFENNSLFEKLQIFDLILDATVDGNRSLFIDSHPLGSHWDENQRFLCVRKF
jgi:hypothetical protein